MFLNSMTVFSIQVLLWGFQIIGLMLMICYLEVGVDVCNALPEKEKKTVIFAFMSNWNGTVKNVTDVWVGCVTGFLGCSFHCQWKLRRRGVKEVSRILFGLKLQQFAGCYASVILLLSTINLKYSSTVSQANCLVLTA